MGDIVFWWMVSVWLEVNGVIVGGLIVVLVGGFVGSAVVLSTRDWFGIV